MSEITIYNDSAETMSADIEIVTMQGAVEIGRIVAEAVGQDNNPKCNQLRLFERDQYIIILPRGQKPPATASAREAELLAANNTEVDRRRSAEAEVRRLRAILDKLEVTVDA